MDEVSRKVYIRFLTEDKLFPKIEEIAVALQEFEVEPNDKMIGEIRDLLFEDFMALSEPNLAALDSMYSEYE